MNEKEISEKAKTMAAEMMLKLDNPEFLAEVAGSWASENKDITHAVFSSKVRAKEWGVKFLIAPYKLLKGSRSFTYVSLVFFHAFLPWIICPLWAWRGHSWWLLIGIPVSIAGARTAANENDPPIASGLLLAAIGVSLLLWLGPYSFWTCLACSAGWGMLWYAVADRFESTAALATLTENGDLFQKLAETGQIHVIKK